MLKNKIITMSALLDLGSLLLFTLIILCFLSKGYLRYFIIIITILYYAIGSGSLGYLLAKPLKYETSNINACSDTKGIILLGAGINNAFGEVEPSIGAYDRIIKTAEVYQKYPQKIIITGGIPKGENISEAKVYAKELYKLGTPEKDIILEEKSKNTYQNAEFVKQIIDKDNSTYCLITGGIHYKRAKLHFDNFDIKTISLASSKLVPDLRILPSAYNFYITQRIVHEYLGIVRIYL